MNKSLELPLYADKRGYVFLDGINGIHRIIFLILAQLRHSAVIFPVPGQHTLGSFKSKAVCDVHEDRLIWISA